MTEVEFRTYIAEQFKDLTPGQRTSAIEAIIAHEASATPVGFSKAWEYSGDTGATLIQARIDHVRAAHPDFFKAPPTVAQLLALAEAEHAAKMGSPMLPPKRLDTFRRLEKLDADARIAELGDRIPPKLEACKPTASTAPPTGDDLDAELRKRGLDPNSMLATDKLRWYRNLGARHKEAAAVMTGSSDDPALSPAQRIAIFRREQAQTQSTKTGARDPRTGLSQDRIRG